MMRIPELRLLDGVATRGLRTIFRALRCDSMHTSSRLRSIDVYEDDEEAMGLTMPGLDDDVQRGFSFWKVITLTRALRSR